MKLQNKYVGYIYKISSDISNKVYIGQTRRSVDRRFKEHITDNNNSYIHRSIQKHGAEHYSVECIEVISCDTLNELQNNLNKQEIYWIDYFDSYYNGYNRTIGGQEGDSLNAKASVLCYDILGELIGEYDSLFQAELETGANRNRITKSCLSGDKYLRANNFIFRYSCDPLTEEDIEKIKLKYPLVFQYDFNGTLIHTYNSLADAANYLFALGFQKVHSRDLSKVCKKDGASAYGYIWRKYPDTFDSYKLPKSSSVKIEQRDLDTGELIQVYESINSAAINTNTNSGSIVGCCNNEQYQANGFYWCYYGMFDQNVFDNKKLQKKKVDMYDLQEKFLRTFNSIKEACEYLNIPYSSTIGQCCINKRHSAHGYIWRFCNNME